MRLRLKFLALGLKSKRCGDGAQDVTKNKPRICYPKAQWNEKSVSTKNKLPDVTITDADTAPPRISHGKKKAQAPISESKAAKPSPDKAATGDVEQHELHRKTHDKLVSGKIVRLSESARTPVFLASSAILLAGTALFLSAFPRTEKVDRNNTAVSTIIQAPTTDSVTSAATNQVSTGILLLDLGRALLTPQPFRNEIWAVRALAANDPDVLVFVEFLNPYADTGVPTKPELLLRLKALAKQSTPTSSETATTWSGGMWGTASSWIDTVWPGQDSENERRKAILAVAISQMSAGSLERTLSALSELGEGIDALTKDLMVNISGRQALDRASAALSELALRRLASSG